ncbi:MAG: ATP-binding protein [Pseudomonas sp.]|uniref:ATP-binding protein n=1 Tax=Pseudomonas sp. TaxID=306 RepID=UPI00299E901A|nr:ATP-binding protein [Pseudomonas sp.]MDX1723951.1 ATP-binding protein [Pseudomonas sp.]
MSTRHNRRILLIDDTPSIHEDFRKILLLDSQTEAELDEVEAALFGEEVKAGAPQFELDSAYQGQEGLAMVCQAMRANRPYAMAFVDMRMPLGWDGVETIEQLWQEDPRLQIVICTAYADYSWEEVIDRLDSRDRLLILKKPFDNIEVCQLASTLTAKWEMTQQAALQMSELEAKVVERTLEIRQASEALQVEILERKQLQSQLLQAEKLASIGQLAAGVAHEINNPIGYISSNFCTLEGYYAGLLEMLSAYEAVEQTVGSPEVAAKLQSLRERLELDFLKEDIPQLMRESRQGIARVRQIVQDLKDFSRIDSTQEWQWANLEEGIDSTLNIVANEIKYKADVVKQYAGIGEIECLPAQLNQVVLNLLVNAAQAMGPERGTISIRTGTAAERVWIEVADTGQGIAAQVLPRIFDPFFTTKPIGQGTGLGLSLSYGIVQKHNGTLRVDSEVGLGSTFRLELPVRQPVRPE